jgi:hypothetical protein
MREYAAYRIYNLITPQSFRARLARVTYVDERSGKTLAGRFGILIEDDDDVAERNGGRITDRRASLARLDLDAFARMTLFEYMIGNVDLSIIAQHNVRLVEVPSGAVYPVPYDFDYSGLVNTTYANAPAELPIQSVRDRLYRGPCRTQEQFEPLFAQFRAIRPELPGIYASLPEVNAKTGERALQYLEGFFKTIDSPSQVKRRLLDQCLKRGLM